MTPVCCLGVDPGKSGALAVVTAAGALLWVEDMRTRIEFNPIRIPQTPKNDTNMDTCEVLAARECLPCKGDVPALSGQTLQSLSAQLGHDWQVINEHHLEKEFSFPDFRQALNFTNLVGAIAEAHAHHPDVYLAWGRVRLTSWTHKVDALTENDFILAAKIESLFVTRY